MLIFFLHQKYCIFVKSIIKEKKKQTVMKKTNWIIGKYVFEEYEDKLVSAIKNSGNNVVFIDDSIDNSEKIFNKFTTDDIIIYHGSFEYARKLNKTSLYPAMYLTLENYECSKYYGYFGDHLLNSRYMMMGLNDVKRNINYLMFDNGSVFIRPSNGYKSFPGQTLPMKNFNQEFDILTKSYLGLDMEQLVVIAPMKPIEEEYRFIVIDGIVVSGSLYMDQYNSHDNRREAYYDKICTDQNALNFAIKMSKIYQPDRTYTIDVCKSNGEYKLLELNSFCCANMYGNDYDKVVDAANKLYSSDHDEVYG